MHHKKLLFYLPILLVSRASCSYDDREVSDDYYEDLPGNDYSSDIVSFREGFNSRSGILTWKKYHPLEDHLKYHEYLLEEYPKLVKAEVIGQSHEGRNLTVLKICPHRQCGRRPIIFIDAAIHGREWISPAAVSFLLKELVEYNEKYKRLTRIFDWFILPFVNPDGYVHTFTKKRDWRVNKFSDFDHLCTDSDDQSGVDLNRNFGYKYADPRPHANDPCSTSYRGTKAFSEPETEAIRDFLIQYKGKIAIVNSVHAAGEKLVIPWGHSLEKYHDEKDLKELLHAGLAAMGEHGKNYTIGNVYQSYKIIVFGGSVNWIAGVLKPKFPFVTELVNKKKWTQTPPVYRIPTEVEGFLNFSIGVAEKAYDILKRMARSRKNKKTSQKYQKTRPERRLEK